MSPIPLPQLQCLLMGLPLQPCLPAERWHRCPPPSRTRTHHTTTKVLAARLAGPQGYPEEDKEEEVSRMASPAMPSAFRVRTIQV